MLRRVAAGLATVEMPCAFIATAIGPVSLNAWTASRFMGPMCLGSANETTICASSAFLMTRFIPKSQQDTLRTDPAYRRVRRGSLEREFSRRTRAGVLMDSDVKRGF